MKLYLIIIASLTLMAPCAMATAQSKPDVARTDNAQTQPAAENVKLTPDVIRAAQRKLNDEGYKCGTADGKMGPLTSGAVRRYQQDKGLKVTGTLDDSTLTHLDVGAGHVMATAPGDIGHGAKAAGHDIKGGHPIAAGEAFGKGVGHAGKAVGQGTKSAVMGTEHKVAGDKQSNESTAPPPPK